MRRQRYVALAVAVVTLSGCTSPVDKDQPNTPPSPATVGLGAASSPPQSPVPSATTTPATSASTTATKKTSKPGQPTAGKPVPSVAENIRGELTLDGPPACSWVPHVFLDGAGGISVQVIVGSVSVAQTARVTLTVVGASGQRGQTQVNLPKGDARQTVSVITNADQGSYQANLKVSLDPNHDIYQTKGYGDDTGSVRVVIPFPRSSTASALDCYMVR